MGLMVAFVLGQITADQVRSLTLRERIETRQFPSVFMAWSPAQIVPKQSAADTVARHDLVFQGVESAGLRWKLGVTGAATEFTSESIKAAQQYRAELQRKNPRLVLLAEIRYRDAGHDYLPEDHRWWKRDAQGKRIVGWEEGGYYILDYGNAEFQAQVAAQAKAAVDSGVFDGIMLDWWEDNADRLALVKTIRRAVGERALILANANDRITPQTAPYINGFFMECYRSKTPEQWKQIESTLVWAEANLRAPRINCVETWYHTSRNDLNLMRATTTLALTRSDGYCLFSDPNELPTPDHLHDWYPFWNKSLGKPKSKGKTFPDESVRREFERGTVLYNRMGNSPVEITFSTPHYNLATGMTSKTHRVPSCDGAIFLTAKPKI